jgi:hypothetical protein
MVLRVGLSATRRLVVLGTKSRPVSGTTSMTHEDASRRFGPHRDSAGRQEGAALCPQEIPPWYENGIMTRVRMDKWLGAA